jgi:hypothetical protein
MIDKDVDWHFGQTMDIPLGERIAIVTARTPKRGEEITLAGRLVFSYEICAKMAPGCRNSPQVQPWLFIT